MRQAALSNKKPRTNETLARVAGHVDLTKVSQSQLPVAGAENQWDSAKATQKLNLN